MSGAVGSRSCWFAVLAIRRWLGYAARVSTLAEIEAAADALPPKEKQELMLFLGARLRAHGAELPEPREFSPEQLADWVKEDETDMQRFREDQ